MLKALEMDFSPSRAVREWRLCPIAGPARLLRIGLVLRPQPWWELGWHGVDRPAKSWN
jgi:hypothetical protein